MEACLLMHVMNISKYDDEFIQDFYKIVQSYPFLRGILHNFINCYPISLTEDVNITIFINLGRSFSVQHCSPMMLRVGCI